MNESMIETGEREVTLADLQSILDLDESTFQVVLAGWRLGTAVNLIHESQRKVVGLVTVDAVGNREVTPVSLYD